jgi:hypothetical protein
MSAINTATMARSLRFTVRFSEEELRSMLEFADRKRLVPSDALRCLVGAGLGWPIGDWLRPQEPLQGAKQ